MFSSLKGRAKLPAVGFALFFFALSLLGPAPLLAQERYPSVARLSFVSGPVTYSRGDDPDEWDDAIENVPVTIGDRIFAPEDGRAELQLSSGNFVRLAPRSYLSTLNLSDDIKQFYLGEGSASFTVRRLQSDEVIEIDTPNVSVTLDEPGRYRIVVDEDGNSRVTVRSGRVTVAANGRQIAVENSEIRVYGIDSPRYETVGLPATDPFDRWVTERDDRFERAYSDAYRHASEDIIGAEDLAEYGRWEEIPEYGYAWTPSGVTTGWAPFSDGRWYWQDPWGWSWISSNRWGWATSHYGRWTPYRSRWYWVPARPRTRVRYAPACVEFVRVRDHVGWFPLHPRDRHIPWWERRDRRRDSQQVTYVNRTYVTVVNHNNFISARPVHRHIVRDSVIVREAKAARFSAESLPVPNRSSLRIVSEAGGRRGHRPSAKILDRAAVVRTAPPAPARTFQDKLPEIQKNQGRPVAPSSILTASQDNRTTARRVRIRPAAEELRGKDFSPRNPGTDSGPAPQPVTAARGKQLATRENSADTGRAERAEKSNIPQQAAQPSPSQPNQGVAGRPAAPTAEQERDRQRREKQTAERQAQQQELDRRKQEQQKEELRKAQMQKQGQEQRRLEPSPQSPSREQQRLEELERQQARQREEQQKAQQQSRQEQERREQLRQQQLQQRQTQQQQRQQEQERKTQLEQQQQDRVRREQLRQQQLQERQAREQLQRGQEPNAQVQQRQEQPPAQQLRQQQLQEREAQQIQRQQQQDRRQQLRQQQLQERQLPQLPRQPGQP